MFFLTRTALLGCLLTTGPLLSAQSTPAPATKNPANKSPATPGNIRAGSSNKPTTSAPISTAPNAAPKAAATVTTAPATTAPATSPSVLKTTENSDKPAVPVASTPPNKLEKYTLAYRFVAGQTLRTRVTQQTHVETSIGGSTQVAEMSSISDKSWLVKSVDSSGNVTFETRWEAIEMRQKMTGRDEVRYNSKTDKTAPAGYEQVASMIGVPLSLITIDPRGKLLNRAAANDKMKTLHDQSTYRATQQLLVPLPPEPVTLGQPWSTPTDIKVTLDKNASRTIQARQRYEIEKLEGNIAVIAHETILPPINDPETKSQVIQQQGKGTIRFDLKTGQILLQTSTVDERVIGFHGADSSIHFQSKFSEEVLPSGQLTQQKSATTSK